MGGPGSGPRVGGGKESGDDVAGRLSKGFPSTQGFKSGYKERGGDIIAEGRIKANGHLGTIASGGGRGPSDATSHTDAHILTTKESNYYSQQTMKHAKLADQERSAAHTAAAAGDKAGASAHLEFSQAHAARAAGFGKHFA